MIDLDSQGNEDIGKHGLIVRYGNLLPQFLELKGPPSYGQIPRSGAESCHMLMWIVPWGASIERGGYRYLRTRRSKKAKAPSTKRVEGPQQGADVWIGGYCCMIDCACSDATDITNVMEFSIRDQYLAPLVSRLRQRGADVELIENDFRHFQVNQEAYVLAKYSTSEGERWQFTFRSRDMTLLAEDRTRMGFFGEQYVALRCGFDGVCLLRANEWESLLQTDRPDTPQTIRVRRPEDCQMSVRGPGGTRLNRKIPGNRFPAMLTKPSRATS